jgi:hypothetical protein
MTDTLITCPHCGGQFPLNEALTAQLHARFDQDHQARLAEAVREAEQRTRTGLDSQLDTTRKLLDAAADKARQAEAREIELRRKTMELEQTQGQAIEKARIETEERLRRETEASLKPRIEEAESKVRAQAAQETQLLQARLAEESKQRQAAQQAELALRQQAEKLEARAREMDLELARRIDAKKTEWETTLRQSLGAEQDLKLKEKERQIDDMKRVIDDLKRKSEQGSQEMQGEVLEIDIQAALERQFPHDLIRPVPKGMTGADLIQDVRDTTLAACGQIIWEVKNTKHWQASWLDKLKADQREAGAALAILVTVALPEGVRGFAQMNGVWVTDLAHYPMLAVALRDQLQQVAFARAAGQGKNEKMEMLYQYLAGDEFRHKVEAIVEAFTALRLQLDKERRAMTRHWAEREKQIERVIGSTTGMYGALQGIIGQGLAAIPALELDDVGLLEGEE